MKKLNVKAFLFAFAATMALAFASIGAHARHAHDPCDKSVHICGAQQQIFVPPVVQQPVVQASVAKKSGKYGAIVVTTSGHFAWGAQSNKKDPNSALNDALAYCRRALIDKNAQGTCAGEATSEWAAGITCGMPEKVTLYSWVVNRKSAAEAATGALARLKSVGPSGCQFQAFAHGSFSGRNYVRGQTWAAKVRCNGKVASADGRNFDPQLKGPAAVLNVALGKVAGNAKGFECQTLELFPS